MTVRYCISFLKDSSESIRKVKTEAGVHAVGTLWESQSICAVLTERQLRLLDTQSLQINKSKLPLKKQMPHQTPRWKMYIF